MDGTPFTLMEPAHPVLAGAISAVAAAAVTRKSEGIFMKRLPTYFISHGGGPWPWVDDMRRTFATLESSFHEMVAELGQPPKAVLMVSGHWETDALRVMAADSPGMEYDYFGFPAHTYKVTYKAPGAPDLAAQVQRLLAGAGINATLDHTQGYDHGTFVPMEIMYPNADVPLIQLSILKDYDPAAHFAIGRALASLRDEGVLIIGSGLSFHNLKLFGPKAKVPSEAFDHWLGDALMQAPDQRTPRILNWESAPYARVCHAQEDHLVPLFVALGAAEFDAATRVYHETDLLGGVAASSFKFG